MVLLLRLNIVRLWTNFFDRPRTFYQYPSSSNNIFVFDRPMKDFALLYHFPSAMAAFLLLSINVRRLLYGTFFCL